MAFDFDSQSFWQWLLGATAAGVGAGGYKVVTHEMRLKQLEDHREKTVDPQLQTLNANVAGIGEKLDEVAGGVNSIRDILMKRGAE